MAAGRIRHHHLLSRRGYEAENLSDFKGLNARSPWFALMMMFLMFSMAGVPPWVGFFGKLNVIDAALDAGLPGLAVLMVLVSVVGAYYYLRVIWYMYFEKLAKTRPCCRPALIRRCSCGLNSLAGPGARHRDRRTYWLWALQMYGRLAPL